MALTPRFGLTHFGVNADGGLSDDGYKFTDRDRLVIDRILGAFENHNHVGGERLQDPGDAEPTLELLPDGELPSGVTFFYRVSYLDRYGLETAAGPEVSIEMPGSVLPPGAPSTNAEAGGALEEGLYFYAFTGHSGENETQMGPPSTVQITDWKSVQLTALEGFPVGTEEVSVWRQGPMESGFTRLVTVPVANHEEALDVYLDDGSIPSDPCPCDPENMPPDVNLTNATNAVRIVIPQEDLDPGTLVRRWRVYRTTESGQYGDASLVAEVVDTVDEEGGTLVNEYIDTGEGDLTPGHPLRVSQTLLPSRSVGGGGSGSGDGGQFFLAASSGEVWRVVASISGQLETRTTGISTDVPMTWVLVDDLDGTWRVSVDDAGVLVTESIEDPEDQDRVFPYGNGPDIPTGDTMVTWRLGVSTEGELATEGAPVPGSDLIYLRPSIFEPATPSEGGVLYLHDGELRFKDAAGAVSVLA